jgi:dihydroneopterin aldolase
VLLNRGTRVLTVNDFITLTGLRVFAHHGVFEHEKQDGQEFVIDVVAWLDLSAAGRSDDLTRTVHYGELSEAVVAEASVNPADLIETVAERVAAVVLSFAAVTTTQVTIHKPHAPLTVPFDDVTVTITRDRS